MAAISTLAAVATAGAAVKGASEASKARKDARKAQEESIAIQEEAMESLRSPQEIIDDLFGPDGLFTEDRLKNITETDQRVTDALLELQRSYGQDVVYGEGGILEAAEQGTERALERIKELGPEFRAALEDPRMAQLVEDQIDRYNKSAVDVETRAAERESAAADFEAATVGAIEGVQGDIAGIRDARTDSAQPFLDRISGISGEGIRGVDTTRISGEGIRDVDLSRLKNLSFEDLQDLDLTQSSGFLGDIRGLTDIERTEAERLTEEARGPLGFETLRRAEQAARAEGGALGRQLDASAVARAALGREEAVMAREDRAAAARARAAEMAGLGAKLGLSQEGLSAELATTAAKLGLTKEEAAARLGLSQAQAATAADVAAAQTAIDQEKAATAADLEAAGLGASTGIELDKLNLAKSELAANLGIDLAKLNSILAAGARQEGLTFREEGRKGFETTFDAARAASVDPSELFLREQALGTGTYADIISGTPSTISTDIGAMINLGSAEDARKAGIAGGMSEILAAQGLGASQRSSDYFGTTVDLLGSLGKFGQTGSAFRTTTPYVLGTSDLYNQSNFMTGIGTA